MQVVLASGNKGKLAELDELLGPLGYQLVAQAELGVTPGPEEGLTFVENALGKARAASLATGLAAIGDDSGIVVAALDGAPGLHSARYAGASGSAAEVAQANNAKLLAELAGVEDRRAYFYCALVFLAHAHDPAPIVATGTWHGRILTTPQGAGGFGYDPLFEVATLGRSAASLSAEEKNAISHRGQAVRELCQQLRDRP